MKAKGLLVIAAAICAAGIVFALSIGGITVDTDVDVVAVNDVVKTAESRWESIGQADFDPTKLSFVILDNAGTVKYETSPGLFTTLNDAVKQNSSIVDITRDGQVAGKLIVHNDDKQTIHAIKHRLALTVGIAFALMAMLCGLYALWLNRTVFKPFKRLQSFAANVARGNLDIPLPMGKDNPFGAFTESFDLMREQLAAARQSEYEANRSKKELVASLSHDIKTPVASIKAVIELMLVGANDEKTVRQLNKIYSKADQIHLLITDMFHAALEEMTELKVTVGEQSSSVLREMFDKADYDELVRCEPIPSCLVRMDETRLQQVIDNVVSNAYKYAKTAVRVLSRIRDGYLEISIMDYGNGVDPDELPLLLNKFYRGTNAKGQSGSGLGLFISGYLMQSMQGEIECRNRNDGFTVVLRLKLAF
ncbi:ATP-binding protein [Paenibacillaceae bacterium WGS1546]|uniref:HAMP domain-containing sensor histidine kinase n=1 Tax=Cohnella sp. WGS1546 TaxID=3366810 RepID=UPI00372D4B1C